VKRRSNVRRRPSRTSGRRRARLRGVMAPPHLILSVRFCGRTRRRGRQTWTSALLSGIGRKTLCRSNAARRKPAGLGQSARKAHSLAAGHLNSGREY
jgi:hypothetical protein